MTTLDQITWLCPLCSTEAERMVMTSTYQMEAPDLDMRPGEMERSTIGFWSVRCPSCGYVEDDEHDATDEQLSMLREFVEEDTYGAQLGDAAYPELANEFLCAALAKERIGRGNDAGWSALTAAWVCDDEDVNDAATVCRLRAVELWRPTVAAGDPPTRQAGAEHVLLADVLRRAGRFAEARVECEHGLGSGKSDQDLEPILRFILSLIAARDSARHTLDEVPEDD